jgi:hypothetical protein
MTKNLYIHNHNMQRKLNLHVQHCSTVLFKESVINIGISLYNKVLDQIKLKENLNSFKRDIKFCWNIAFILLMNSCPFDFSSVWVYHCFYDMIKILFSLNLHNFGYSVAFDYWISASGIIYCISFFLLLYIVYSWCVHNLYVVKYYSIVDLYKISMLY